MCRPLLPRLLLLKHGERPAPGRRRRPGPLLKYISKNLTLDYNILLKVFFVGKICVMWFIGKISPVTPQMDNIT